MNSNKNNSLLEIAIKEMENKKKPKTLDEIINDVFQIKGIKEKDEYLSQFIMDFMLSGSFICCGEDKRKKKLWDLKERQPSNVLDKDGTYYDEPYDEDVVRNELSDETLYKVAKGLDEDDDDLEEEDDDIEETDEIAEDLSEFDDGDQDDDGAYDDDEDDEFEIVEDFDDDDELDEDDDDDEDDELED